MVGETNSIRVNGEHRRVPKGMTVGQLLEEMGLAKATVERNAQLLTDHDRCVEDGDDYEIFEQL
jgi:thiazole synthase